MGDTAPNPKSTCRLSIFFSARLGFSGNDRPCTTLAVTRRMVQLTANTSSDNLVIFWTETNV